MKLVFIKGGGLLPGFISLKNIAYKKNNNSLSFNPLVIRTPAMKKPRSIKQS